MILYNYNKGTQNKLLSTGGINIMNIKLKTGDIVKIENAYFKSDNGLYFVTNCPGDAGWNGDDNEYCLKKICKNGKISKAKNAINFWPLCSYVSDQKKAEKADTWDAEHATITKIDGINTEFIIEYFKNKVEEYTNKYNRNFIIWGEKDKYTISYKATLGHYKNVVARMTCVYEDAEQERKEEIQVIKGTKEETVSNNIINDAKEEKINTIKAQEINGQQEESQAKERNYYPINEDTARIAKEVNSFKEYKKGDATAEEAEEKPQETAAGTTEESKQETISYIITEDTHTKTGNKIWVVKPGKKLNRTDFAEVKQKLATLQGFYSTLKKGFVFKYNPEEILRTG